tara:strand:- start:243 stop:512 length:270 start_codon:yes stop_codon:yes gene_type:complete
MKYKIKPFPQKRELRFNKKKEIKNIPKINSDRRKWTLSYRLNGLTFGLALAGIYTYYFLEYWSNYILIITPILGYFLGYLVGNFLYTKK